MSLASQPSGSGLPQHRQSQVGLPPPRPPLQSPTPGPHACPYLCRSLHLSLRPLRLICDNQVCLGPGATWTSDGPARCLPRLWESPSSQPFPHHGLHCPGPGPTQNPEQKKRRAGTLGQAYSMSLPGPGTVPRRNHRIQTSNNPLGYCHLTYS